MLYRKRSPGQAISAQRLAHWLVDAVTKAYTMANKPVPKLTAHSTRGVATLVAALMGTDWEVIRRTASWKGDLTFKRHYYRHVNVRSVADAVGGRRCPSLRMNLRLGTFSLRAEPLGGWVPRHLS